MQENLFKVEFILPIEGEFLIINKVLGVTYLAKDIKVFQYTYDELINGMVIEDKYEDKGFV